VRLPALDKATAGGPPAAVPDPKPPPGQVPLTFPRAAPPPAQPAPAPPARRRRFDGRDILRAAGRGAAFGALLVAVAWVTGQVAMRLAQERDKVDLPRVVGLESVAAIELLKERGLVPKVVSEEYSSRVGRGRVASQQPSGTMRVRPGAEVRLIISRGSDTSAVPDLAGLPLEEAQRLLSEQGLRAGTVTEVQVDHQPAGVVIAHDPPAGEAVQRGTVVHVLVNRSGEAEVATMPNVVGAPVRGALAKLQTLGVEARISFERAERLRDMVVRQEPPAGGPLRRGQRAILVVGQ
jgi:eukaryotic-like serine/threonine-protein kinase